MSMKLTGNQNNCSYNLKYLICKYHARGSAEEKFWKYSEALYPTCSLHPLTFKYPHIQAIHLFPIQINTDVS